MTGMEPDDENGTGIMGVGGVRTHTRPAPRKSKAGAGKPAPAEGDPSNPRWMDQPSISSSSLPLVSLMNFLTRTMLMTALTV